MQNLRIATAHGRGSGRFLVSALLDVLDSGSPLVAVRRAIEPPAAGPTGVDFVFRVDDDHREVIRVGLSEHGEVVSAEILRARGGGAGCYRCARELASVLRAGQVVLEIRWDDTAALLVVTPGPTAYRLELAAFDREEFA